MLRRLWWLPVAAIFILSIVPPSLRPVLGPHTVEHAAAFGIAAICFGVAQRRPLWVLLLASATFACAIEFLQLFVHGRHASLRDLVIDLLAAVAGTILGHLLRDTLAPA
jgi:VanZ family protein